MDAIVGLLVIGGLLWLATPAYRWQVGGALLGSVFPDLVDHSAEIINQLLGAELPVFHNFFPWHWHEQSGSVYSGVCGVSTLNHACLLLTVGVLMYYNIGRMQAVFGRRG